MTMFDAKMNEQAKSRDCARKKNWMKIIHNALKTLTGTRIAESSQIDGIVSWVRLRREIEIVHQGMN